MKFLYFSKTDVFTLALLVWLGYVAVGAMV